jgi:hypothetical protein
MRAFDEDTQRQLTAFDKETQRGLAGLVAPTQTAQEKALADFLAARQAAEDAAGDEQRQQALATALAGGDPEAIAQAQQDINTAALDEQQRGLEAAAQASRTAADQAAQDAQSAYQDQRDLQRQALQDQRDDQKQALQDANDDQRTLLQANLDNWVEWLDTKKKTWAEFVKWLQDNGFDTSGLVNPNTGKQNPSPNDTSFGSPNLGRPIGIVPMADGGVGRVLGPTLFYSAGDEDFAFSGEGRSFGTGGASVLESHITIELDGQPLWRGVQRNGVRHKKRNGSTGL